MMITGKEILLCITFFFGVTVVKVPDTRPIEMSDEIKKIEEDIEQERETMRLNALHLSDLNII